MKQVTKITAEQLKESQLVISSEFLQDVAEGFLKLYESSGETQTVHALVKESNGFLFLQLKGQDGVFRYPRYGKDVWS